MTDIAHLLPVLFQQRASPLPASRCGGGRFQDDFGWRKIVFQLRRGNTLPLKLPAPRPVDAVNKDPLRAIVGGPYAGPVTQVSQRSV
jgi:hypothetical protein